MTDTEERISNIEDSVIQALQSSGWRDTPALDYLIVRALCEITRELSRIGDLLEKNETAET